jgi:glucokinase
MEREKRNDNSALSPAIVIGVDIGGSHITAARIDMNNRQLVTGTEVRHHVDPHSAADSVIHAWAQCIRAAAGTGPLQQVCIAMPGPFDYEEGISLIKGLDKYAALYKLNIKQLLAQKLGISTSQLFLHNDAACFLQGELFSGDMDAHHPVVGITLGTGLGSATCRETVSQDAGLWEFPYKGKIAEESLSTRWFIRRWTELSGETVKGVKELADIVETDDRIKPLFQEFADNLAAVLIAFIRKESAKAVVIGGNIAHAFPLFKESLLQQIRQQYPSIVIQVSRLGEKAALVGAAGSWHALNHNLLPH